MKKNYGLILIFLLLAGATTWYLLSGGKSDSTVLGWDRNFKIENRDDIYKVFIAKRSGETTMLERKGNEWYVNGDSKASKKAVESVLSALVNFELQYVPTPSSTSNIVKELATRGIKVEVFNKSGDKLKGFYIGGATPDARGTYMIMEGADQPMVIGMSTLVGQLRIRFDLVGDDWRDRNVFSYKPEQIQQVEIEYPQHRNKSFRLKRSGSGFDVSPFYDNTPPINRKVDEVNVENFLNNFDGLMAEGFSNDYAYQDSVRHTIPFSVVTVGDVEGHVQKVAIYPTYRLDAETGERTADIVERYFADVNSKDWMTIQHRVFEKIFWAYEAFFEPEGKKIKG